MAAQLKTSLHHEILDFNPDLLESEPLQINELLSLLALANDFGYTVRSAHDFKSVNKPVLAEIYSVWYAIEHELPIFTHNIPRLIQLKRIKHLDVSIQ